MKEMGEFAKLLAAKRAADGISMRDAAEQADVTLNTYFRAEHGTGIGGEQLLKLVKWLGQDVSLLGASKAFYERLRVYEGVRQVLNDVSELGAEADKALDRLDRVVPTR